MDMQRIAIAPYAAADMYALADDIAGYPEFLPWCSGAEVERPAKGDNIPADGELVNARLTIGYHRIQTSFSTANIHTPPSSIQMRLLDGPLKSLEGEWRFLAIEDNRSRIELNLHYEFKNNALGALFAGLFESVFDRFADHFVERAKTLYGEAGRDKIAVEVVRADAANTPPQRLFLPVNATVADALAAVGVGGDEAVGVFGKQCPPQTPLTDGARVEIYKALVNDPRAARRQKAKS